MQLEKFAFIDSKYIRWQRAKCRRWVYKKLKGQSNHFKIKAYPDNKWKYIQKLFLFNARLNNREEMVFDKRTNTMSNTNLFKCNIKWPICLYDHSFKSRCASYFAFRCAEPIPIIPSYFGSTSVAQPADEFLFLNPPSSSEIDLKMQKYDSLLIERNIHYCTNKDFVTKIRKLLEQERTEWAFDDSCISSNVNGDSSLLHAMDNYTAYITDIDEDFIEGIEESESLHNSVFGSPERYGASGSLTERPKKGFQLGMYITSITPNKKEAKN
eukprot:TRINITY_DN858_c0_g2_i2.p1 TRINITY_DN858_c0_g2~~TRINITY_DN858_c0_g2_i2.p1  ORF type:complete len:269 (-),score=66.13 TRINITY_DN858_c0_g2_i2:77-883(-)